MSGIYGTNKKGLNIEVTSGQYEFLYDLVMMAYELDIPQQKGWDMQTFDNLVDNVCNAKETYLSNNVRGSLMKTFFLTYYFSTSNQYIQR